MFRKGGLGGEGEVWGIWAEWHWDQWAWAELDFLGEPPPSRPMPPPIPHVAHVCSSLES